MSRALSQDAGRALLTADQSRALWRRVVAESPVAETLLDSTGSARWAAGARRLLADWKIDAHDLRADRTQGDLAAFLAWHRNYVERLEHHEWQDEAALASAAPPSLAGEALMLLDLNELSPADRDFLDALERDGCSIAYQSAPRVTCRARRVALGDMHAELRAAATWARRTLAAESRARVALVVPGLERQLETVRQTLLETLGRDCVLGIELDFPERAQPLVGSALHGIELSSTRGSFATLSHWLRSPFFQGTRCEARSRAAIVEAALRTSMAAQLGFLSAYEQGGLAAMIEQAAPDIAARLRDGLRELLAPRGRATLDVWARAWTRGLAKLGWPGVESASTGAAVRAFDAALATLTQLTPVLGELAREQAIDELRSVLKTRALGPLPLFGVHVLEHMDHVGPGYAGVWVTGLTDQSWPPAARLNPLLPRRLQIEHRLPWSTPADVNARARASQERLLQRTPQAVFSWPATLHDYATQPSPLIVAFEEATSTTLGCDPESALYKPSRALERIEDRAPVLAGSRIDGGARTLALQARCPVRAFCERRLRARALEAPVPGLGLRRQGIVMHRALELLLRDHPSQQALRGLTDGEQLVGYAEAALAAVFGPARAALRVLFDLESTRTSALLARFVASELGRPAFRAIALEERADIEVGPWTLTCRIDRIDAAADGTAVLVDYKTGGNAPGPYDWLGDRLTETQLPLYALKAGVSSGVLTIGLAGEEVIYRGLASDPSLVARKHVSALPEGRTWALQIERWRAQIRVLADGYASGDTRIYLDDATEALGAYAPLTRVYAAVQSPAEVDA